MKVEVRQTATFAFWLSRLRNDVARTRTLDRLRRLGQGNSGDARPVGNGVWELRVNHGPGYRVYYVWKGATIVLLLCGGDKRRPREDIAHAQRLVMEERG